MDDDLIRRNDVKELMKGFVFANSDCRECAENIVDAIPSVDAVQVVRCWECKYYVIEKSHHVGWCNVYDDYISSREYCSAGEKND